MFQFVQRFIRLEASGGLLLMGAAALALLIANSPWGVAYEAFLARGLPDALGPLHLPHSPAAWINDGLMVLFFLLVGLEIKREALVGELSGRGRVALPALAAVGGMAVPALVYALINRGDTSLLRGWAIPSATDIAFSLAVLALLGARAPASLKVFLTALAILDDLGAVVVIAIFYTDHLVLPALSSAAACAAVLLALNKLGVARLWPYLLVGLVLWALVMASGVHATVAGVVLAAAIPLRTPGVEHAPLLRLEHSLHPWVTYLVLPVFGLANAGVALGGLPPGAFTAPLTLGIAAGLFLGKQVGVLGATWAAVKLGLAERPAGATWPQVYGAALLTGIGFTMSLFIGNLAFEGGHQPQIRLGVIVGSIASALVGAGVLLACARPKRAP